jgi:uncharacterized OB-fold protein
MTDATANADTAATPPTDEHEPLVVTRPIRLEFDYTPGASTSPFLRKVEEREIEGQRCPVCRKVYVPPRGSCARCGVATDERVPVETTGTVTSFCIVDIPFAGQHVECPYVCANVLLDGADIAFQHLVQEIDAHDVRMGLRVEAVWGDTAMPNLASIDHFRPTGEPDASYDTFKDAI